LTVLTEEQSFFWDIYQILSYPAVWLSFLISGVIAILPDIIIKILENTVHDHREAEKLKRMNHKADTELPKMMREWHRKRDCNTKMIYIDINFKIFIILKF
jgi:hypothetical protein